MECDQGGERFDHFFPTIPYTVCGAAWIDDDHSLTRWRAPSIRLDGIPFIRLVSILPHVLGHFHRYLSAMDEEAIRAFESSSEICPI